MDTKQALQRLADARGVTGYEGAAADVVESAFTGLVDDIRRDSLGSVIMFKRGCELISPNHGRPRRRSV